MIALALRQLAREWRAGELRVLLLAVALAVASLTAVAFFGDRVGQALGREANTLLAADLALAADHAIDPAFAAEAGRRRLATAETATFLSMAQAGDEDEPRGLLVGVKAVTSGYPLRGELRIATAPFAADAPTRALPAVGEVWIDERLATGLEIGVGDRLRVGELEVRVAAILTFEGERGGNFLAMAPRLLLPMADLAGTGLVQEGSRIAWRLLVAGEPEAVAGFRDWSQPRLSRGEKLEDVRDARPELRQVLDRAQRYLGLSAMLTVVLAAAAARLTLRRYLQRQFDRYALMRCFGASQRRLLGIYLIQLVALGLLAGLLGAGIGWVSQQALTGLLGDLLRIGLPAPSPMPLLLGLVTGLALVLAFALPPVLRLAKVPALRVLRRELGPPPGRALFAHLAGLALLAGLLFWQAGDLRLGLIVAAGVVAAFAIAAGLTRALLWPLAALAPRLPVGARLGLDGLRQRGWETTVQVVALSLGLLALLLLTLVRGDLLDAWRGKAPPDAPNRFVINIQPEQVAAVRDHLRAAGVDGVELHPMARARLIGIGGRTVTPEDYPEGRARRLAEREFNLSSLATLPPDNVVVAGRWWRAGDRDGFSVEAGLAETLGIRLGDHLEFDVGGLPLAGPVVSLRTVEWDSFRANFFVVAPPGTLDALPRSHITSFHLPPERAGVLAGLVAAFPNLTVIDVTQLMNQIRDMTDRVSLAVQFIFVFSLGVGVLVMLAALYARRDERAREIGVWRALGASRRRARAALASEFALLGLLAGAIAAGIASTLAWLLAREVFDLPHQPDPTIWLAGIGGGVILVLAAGLFATRGLIDAPPMEALRAD